MTKKGEWTMYAIVYKTGKPDIFSTKKEAEWFRASYYGSGIIDRVMSIKKVVVKEK